MSAIVDLLTLSSATITAVPLLYGIREWKNNVWIRDRNSGPTRLNAEKDISLECDVSMQNSILIDTMPCTSLRKAVFSIDLSAVESTYD